MLGELRKQLVVQPPTPGNTNTGYMVSTDSFP